MKLALALYRYFPYGGLQRDFLRVARAALARGHQVRAFVAEWDGDVPPELDVRQLPVSATANHRRMAGFAEALAAPVRQFGAELTLGFNRLPGIDAYFASDSCFAEQVAAKPAAVRWLPRYRTYLELERRTLERAYCFFLNEDQKNEYGRHYALAPGHTEVLPPGIEESRRRPGNAAEVRAAARQALGLSGAHRVILFLGSGFRVKGLDRALAAFAALPAASVAQARLLIVGNDDATPYLKVLSSEQRRRVQVLGPRDDVPALLQAADVLLHPAYRESAGLVLLEAAAAGLPVLTTDTCGYARYVREAGAGEVLASPFRPSALADTLATMLAGVPGDWARRGIEFGRQAWLYRLPERVVERLEALRNPQ